MTYLLPPNDGRAANILPSDLICRSNQRAKGKTTPNGPMLNAMPDATIVLGYQENGHITGNMNPDKLTSGAVSIYGTTDSLPSDTLLNIHHVWNANNTGGDKRGTLLIRSSFDDGSCYQVSDTALSVFRSSILHRPFTSSEGMNL